MSTDRLAVICHFCKPPRPVEGGLIEHMRLAHGDDPIWPDAPRHDTTGEQQ